MAKRGIETLLADHFNPIHVRAMLRHFQGGISEYRSGNWEDSIAKMGKAVEAALKALCKHAAVPVGSGKDFKVDRAINGLGALPRGSSHESVRLTVPRACRFVYDVASNRGGRHDAGEVDPNQMDSTALVAVGSWIVAEMVRYAQKGSLHPDEAEQMVTALTERHSPVVERVDGRAYFHIDGKSAREVAILALWQQHPRRMSREDIIATVIRNGFTRKDALTALGRISGAVDDDGARNFRLLGPGLAEAERLAK